MSLWTAGHRAATVSPFDALSYTHPLAFRDQTVRQSVHLHRGGERFRLRFSNRFGTGPLRLGAVRAAGARVTFGGAKSAVIPAGEGLLSDPVDVAVPDGHDLPVHLYVDGPSGPPTRHPDALRTGSFTDGDTTADPDAEPAGRFLSLNWLAGVDLWRERADGEPVIVAFGDSLTDGSGTPPDRDLRYPDHLSRRLGVPVLNLGIGGNQLLRDGFGDAGLRRFRRDALSVPGLTHVIIELGINDLGLPSMLAQPKHRAGAIVDGLLALAAQARAAGVASTVATLPPYRDVTHGDYFAEKAVPVHAEINDRLRDSGEHLLDLHSVLAGPDGGLNPAFDQGDRLHPNPAGMAAIADAYAQP
ncbi:SGNH/GDSL hydrolase family protein [Actinocorallia lasiicapitis]